MTGKKEEIVSFKVNNKLAKKLNTIPNKSEFIRKAIVAALDDTCPLCRGTGTLSIDQKTHWTSFMEDHSLEECGKCHSSHLVCKTEKSQAK